MSLLDNVLKYLPTIATAIANPVAGIAELAAQFLGPKLNVQNTVEAVTQRLAGMSPEEMVKMKQLDVELQQHLADNGIRLAELEIQDTQSARTRDVELAKATGGRPNYMAISMYILSVSVVGFLVYQVLVDDTISEFAKGIITLALGRFLGYLDGIYNFEFGTTRSSRMKDETIQNMAKGNGNG